jgi:hypothetical protein
MNLIQKLQNDIIDPKTNLSSILREAKVLASVLKNEEFKKWVNNELNGYQDNMRDIPDYRRLYTQSFGFFAGPFGGSLKNAPIPSLSLPEKFREFSTKLVFTTGVRVLETYLEDERADLNVHWPADLIAIISDKVYQGYNCISAWKIVDRGQIVQILDTVRNRLLNFVLELQERYPEINKSEDAISAVPNEQVTPVFNTYILGDHNVVASGSNISQEVSQQIRKNDLDALLRYMEDLGVSKEEAQELKTAIEEDGPRKEPNKFGLKVAGWVGRMVKKILEGAWNVAIETAPKLITKALSRYYGWE